MSYFSRVPDGADAFRALYESAYSDLLSFVVRRTEVVNAEDIVAEAFLIVWRRFSEAPAQESEARAWVFGIARNLLLNAQRGERRRQALGVRLAEATSMTYSTTDVDAVSSRVDLGRAWKLLPEVHQETLTLTVLENVSAPQAAKILEISPVAFRLRLSRARRALRRLLDHHPHDESVVPATSSEKASTP